MAETEPQIRRLGYALVSTDGHTLDAQLEQLRAEDCARIYREKASGVKADRRELRRLLKNLAVGDVVRRIDRLARSTFGLFAIVKQIVDAGEQFRSLAEPWADTATSTGWKGIATYARSDARSLVIPLRTKTPAELTLWLKYFKKCKPKGKNFRADLPELEQALRKAGFTKFRWWKHILADNEKAAV